MKGKDVQVGSTYAVKVSGVVSPVRITGTREVSSGRTQWLGINTKTGRSVTIRGAGRIRHEIK